MTHSSVELHFMFTFHPLHVTYQKERWQNTPLTKTNTHLKWLWLFIIYKNTNFSLTVKWLNGHQQMPIDAILLQHSPELISKNPVICLFWINKACEDIFCIPQEFLKNWPESENLARGAATWTKTALAIFQLWFHYFSQHFFQGTCDTFFLKN